MSARPLQLVECGQGARIHFLDEGRHSGTYTLCGRGGYLISRAVEPNFCKRCQAVLEARRGNETQSQRRAADSPGGDSSDAVEWDVGR